MKIFSSCQVRLVKDESPERKYSDTSVSVGYHLRSIDVTHRKHTRNYNIQSFLLSDVQLQAGSELRIPHVETLVRRT